MERTSGYVLQGYHYLLETEKTVGRVQASFDDPVNTGMLQNAIDAVMKHTDYFHQKLICENGQFFLAPNDVPCVIYPEGKRRLIPEETNGYLFYVSCKDNTVFLTFWHFLTDGHGSIRFMNELLMEYCNRRYNEHFVCQGLYSAKPYSIEALKTKCPEKIVPARRRSIPVMKNGEVHSHLLRLDRNSVLRAALAQDMWPFDYLLYLLCRFVQEELQADQISFGYPIDVRDVAGSPDALYNCIDMHWEAMDFRGGDGDEEKAKQELIEKVGESLKPMKKLESFLREFQVWTDLCKLDKPLRDKQMIVQMLYRSCQSHLNLSYLENPLSRDQKAMEKYLTDYRISLLSTDMAFMAVVNTFQSYMNLTVTERLCRRDMADRLRDALSAEDIKVLDVENLD